jgi:histidine phosphotransferase ChpT
MLSLPAELGAMDTQLDSRVMELLCARLCHDLIGPIAAVNNGVELVRDYGDEMHGEALALIGESATKVSQLLQFYRVAFGSARAADGSGIGIEEARQRVLDALSSERITIQWPDKESAGDGEASRLAVKLILNLVLLGVEILPGAGEVCVEIKRGNPGQVQITAKKNGLSMREDFDAVLNGEVSPDDLTPRTVQAFFTRFLADSIGGVINIRTGDSYITLVVNI